MKHLSKLMLGAGMIGFLVPIGAWASPAGATTVVAAINCQAVIPALGNLTLSIQNPSESRVDGPTWSPHGPAAATITNKGSEQVLPSSAGGQTIQYYTNLVTRSQVIGENAPPSTSGAEDTTITAVANQQLNGFFFDNDVTDATPPVPMDGIGADPPKPTLTIAANALAGPGQYSIETDTAQGSFHLNVTGAVGGAIFSPDLPLALTNVGNAQGTVDYVNDSTALTAHLSLGVDAVTTCSNPAAPAFRIHVHNAGDPISTSDPVVSCQPANGTNGTLSIAKGLWNGAAGVGDPALQAGGSLKAAVTYDGCKVPDQQADAWVLSKHGAPAAIATSAAKALLSLKGKNFGDCTLASVRDNAGEHENGHPNSYQTTGTFSAKYTDGSGVIVKVPGTAASGTIKLVIDESVNTGAVVTPLLTLEANGVVTKGLGVGGAAKFVGEIPGTATVSQIEACNGFGSLAPPFNTFLGAVVGGLSISTGADATFEVSRP